MTITNATLEQWLAELPGRLIGLVIIAGIGALTLWLGFRLTRYAQGVAVNILRRAQPHEAEVLTLAVQRVVAVAGIAFTFVLVLALLGVDVGALFAGLGLTSLGLAFALKDTIEQAIAGMLLLFQRPFKVGDVIEVENVEGVVEDVAIRTTNIRMFDGVHAHIPNNKVFQAIIRNKSHYTMRRFTLTLGIAYDSNLPEAHCALLAAVENTPGVLADPTPTVAYEAFDAASIHTVVRYWIEPAHTDVMMTQTAVMRAIIDAARQGGIDVPYPIRPAAINQPPSAVANASGNAV